MQMGFLGSTGLQVSRLGLGLAALGRPGYINLGHAADLGHQYDVAAMQQQAHAVLDHAWQLGIRYFDAARSYGKGEIFLGTWLTARALDRSAVTIGSKWGYTYTAGWQIHAEHHEIKEHTLPVLRRQSAESRANLGPYLRLYQTHSATLESGVLTNADVLEELVRLRHEDGWRIGLSLSGPRQAETLRVALQARAAGERVFDCVQTTWNLLEPSAGQALAEAHSAGLGIIIKEALANGRLTARNLDSAFASRRELLQREAARLDCTLDALALAGVLAQPWVDVVLSGATTCEQLTSNVSALAVAWDEEATTHLHALAEEPATYWQTRAGLAWN